jgi:hypothetical protein
MNNTKRNALETFLSQSNANMYKLNENTIELVRIDSTVKNTLFYDFYFFKEDGKISSGYYTMNNSKNAGTRKIFFSRKGFYFKEDGKRVYLNTFLLNEK